MDIEDGNFNLEYKTRPIIETKFEIFKDLVDRKTVQKVMDRYRMVGLAKKVRKRFLFYKRIANTETSKG